jgi:hypothetical protein
MDRLNDLRLLRIVAQRGADLAHRHLEHGVAHEDARPDRVEQIVLGDETPAVLGEATQEREGFRSQRDLLTAAPDTLVGAIELEGDRTGLRNANPGGGRESRLRGERDRGGHYISQQGGCVLRHPTNAAG